MDMNTAHSRAADKWGASQARQEVGKACACVQADVCSMRQKCKHASVPAANKLMSSRSMYTTLDSRPHKHQAEACTTPWLFVLADVQQEHAQHPGLLSSQAPSRSMHNTLDLCPGRCPAGACTAPWNLALTSTKQKHAQHPGSLSWQICPAGACTAPWLFVLTDVQQEHAQHPGLSPLQAPRRSMHSTLTLPPGRCLAEHAQHPGLLSSQAPSRSMHNTLALCPGRCPAGACTAPWTLALTSNKQKHAQHPNSPSPVTDV
eukprot:1161292-Pelagomonas_calceolata.AAC.5